MVCQYYRSGIAMIGTLTSLLIPRTQPPNPDLRMPLGMVFVPHETWRFIFSQPALRNCLIMVVLFWFIGGVTQPAVNSLGELVFHLSKTRSQSAGSVNWRGHRPGMSRRRDPE